MNALDQLVAISAGVFDILLGKIEAVKDLALGRQTISIGRKAVALIHCRIVKFFAGLATGILFEQLGRLNDRRQNAGICGSYLVGSNGSARHANGLKV